jgi:thiol-disulfide isomerase/thioredoxin
MIGGLVALAAIVLATAFGLMWRRRDGTLRAPRAGSIPAHDGPRDSRESEGRMERLGASELGVELGPRATLVQFSSAFCAPCRATRRLLGEVSGMVDGVAHVEIDAEAHLDLVRRLNIIRTPTVLILDREGRVTRRGSGLPRKADIISALGETVA